MIIAHSKILERPMIIPEKPWLLHIENSGVLFRGFREYVIVAWSNAERSRHDGP
jgi:hypothetical protein